MDKKLDYNELISNVLEVLNEIKNYSLGKLECILEDEEISDESFLKKWINLTQSVCYGKSYCNLLGVDYVNLLEDDLKKINVFTLYLLKKNENLLLPIL